MLAVAIGIEAMPTGYSEKSFVRDLTDNCNRRNYAAQMAGRASVQLYTRVFFRESPRTVVATVLGVRKTGIAVIVMEFGFEGFVRMLERESYHSKNLKHQHQHHSNTGTPGECRGRRGVDP